MSNPWQNDLKFWQTGEWDVIKEKLNDLTQGGISYNPGRTRLFNALSYTALRETKVCLLGQDPYPNPAHASGLAFSALDGSIPASLSVIFDEYVRDLHYPRPTSGDLTPWAREGVLLWNCIPTCLSWQSFSHRDWPEWELLTGEILTKLSEETSCVFIALGVFAKSLTDKYIKEGDAHVIYASHPSPRASRSSRVPFLGSRIFTTANSFLSNGGQETVDWRLE